MTQDQDAEKNNEQTIHVDSMEINKGIPDFDESLTCPVHPTAKVGTGYGLAGGGFGPYTTCEECGRVLSKSGDSEF